MGDDNGSTFFGVFIGLFIASCLNALPWADASLYSEAKHECEKTLPRNQECKVIGVVK